MSVLDRIFELRRLDVAEAKRKTPLTDVRSAARDQAPPRGFRSAIAGSESLSLIAEIKFASPSSGVLRRDGSPAAIAAAFEQAGASALSVLTEQRHFGGCLEHMSEARASSSLPVLRKDFIDDPYQIAEARAWGADAVLLIVAALGKEKLEELLGEARSWRMDALVEVHNEAECEAALACGADLVGVNNRDLSTLETDIATSERLLPLVAGQAVAVSESALACPADVKRVRAAGADAVLIGTAFSDAIDIRSKVRGVMGWE
jgi:indole-3-glycerol phosphate synthase